MNHDCDKFAYHNHDKQTANLSNLLLQKLISRSNASNENTDFDKVSKFRHSNITQTLS